MAVNKLSSSSLSPVFERDKDIPLQKNSSNMPELPDSNAARIITKAASSQKSLISRFISHLKFTLLSIVTIGMYAVTVINSLKTRIEVLEDAISKLESALNNKKNERGTPLSPKKSMKSPIKTRSGEGFARGTSPFKAGKSAISFLTSNDLSTGRGLLKKVGTGGSKIASQPGLLSAVTAASYFANQINKRRAAIEADASESDSEPTPVQKENSVSRRAQLSGNQGIAEASSQTIQEKRGPEGGNKSTTSSSPTFLAQTQASADHPSLSSGMGGACVPNLSPDRMLRAEKVMGELKQGVKLKKTEIAPRAHAQQGLNEAQQARAALNPVVDDKNPAA